MARPPVPGHCKTRLLAGFEPAWAAGVVESMTRDTLAHVGAMAVHDRTIFAAPAPDEKDAAAARALATMAGPGWRIVPQRGEDLGARMRHALSTMLDDGADCAALVGTDSPTAPFSSVAEAMAGLLRGIAVAPSEDGGYWAIAMPAVANCALEGMPWSSSRLLDATRAACAARAVGVVELATWYDVDEPEDVERLASDLASEPGLAPHSARFLAAGLPLRA
jgi:rSAM/selenodomain-associated transferase 1